MKGTKKSIMKSIKSDINKIKELCKKAEKGEDEIERARRLTC
jgi:hypothetical protein